VGGGKLGNKSTVDLVVLRLLYWFVAPCQEGLREYGSRDILPPGYHLGLVSVFFESKAQSFGGELHRVISFFPSLFFFFLKTFRSGTPRNLRVSWRPQLSHVQARVPAMGCVLVLFPPYI